jgi:5-methylcytosine-specific restriction protein A
LLILDRDRWRCQMRGPRCVGYATQVDHVIPLADGGGNDPANLRAACHRCNGAGGAERTNRRRWQHRTTMADYTTRF